MKLFYIAWGHLKTRSILKFLERKTTMFCSRMSCYQTDSKYWRLTSSDCAAGKYQSPRILRLFFVILGVSISHGVFGSVRLVLINATPWSEVLKYSGWVKYMAMPKRVLIWPEPSEAHRHYINGLLRNIQSNMTWAYRRWLKYPMEPGSNLPVQLRKCPECCYSTSLKDGIRDLLSRPWLSRLRTLEDLSRVQQAIIVCGSTSFLHSSPTSHTASKPSTCPTSTKKTRLRSQRRKVEADRKFCQACP